MAKEIKIETQKQAHTYYYVDKNGCKAETTQEKRRKIDYYDEIVDYASFRPDKENERIARITGDGGKMGRYDSDENPPSNLIVDIRQGKYDRAEVQEMLEEKKKEVKEQQKEAIAEARQEFLDQKTGFTGQPQEEKK